MIGVAISTTAEPHRLGFLETAAVNWWKTLASMSLPTTVFVTVDGDEAAATRAARAVAGFAEVVWAGMPLHGYPPRSGRQGVAVNKNTGIEALMSRGVTELYLSDDDCYPKSFRSLGLHQSMSEHVPHSMVSWGKHRNPRIWATDPLSYAEWSWPRGVMLMVTRAVVEQVGGFVEAFGPGGHEHVEYSRRIHQHGLTPTPFPTPSIYAHPDHGTLAMRAREFWACQDMPRVGEPLGNLRLRRRKITSVHREDGDWDKINSIMERMDGHTEFVPYAAADNGRAPATMIPSNPT